MTPRLHRSQLSLYPSDGDLGALEGGEVADWLLPWMACPEVSPDWSRTSGAAYWRVKQGVLIPSSPSRGFRRAKPKSTTFNSASSASEANNRFCKKSWHLCTIFIHAPKFRKTATHCEMENVPTSKADCGQRIAASYFFNLNLKLIFATCAINKAFRRGINHFCMSFLQTIFEKVKSFLFRLSRWILRPENSSSATVMLFYCDTFAIKTIICVSTSLFVWNICQDRWRNRIALKV